MGENLLMHVSIFRQHCKHLAGKRGRGRVGEDGVKGSRGSMRQEKHGCAAAPQMACFSKHEHTRACVSPFGPPRLRLHWPPRAHGVQGQRRHKSHAKNRISATPCPNRCPNP
jgi:hypothetical protein